MTTQSQKFKIAREFYAPKEIVFNAFASAEALSEWWGPVGMSTTVKSFSFKVGGEFHYKLEGKGQVMWGLFKYKTIQPYDLLEYVSSFSDENGNICKSPFPIDFPLEVFNRLTFEELNGITTITLEGHPINATDDQVNTFHSMKDSMNQGFTGTLNQLDQYLKAHFKLRNEMKASSKARTSTYLNFPGNTEEAFNFYKSVFGTEFNGQGILRFGDIPADAGQPPVAENVKNMVLHVELPILGGHILMATDAPKEMGFNLTSGNNMHICLEPETKAETKRLFDALSQGGSITMPLADMFWGTFYGTCVDRFGINWMFNCTESN